MGKINILSMKGSIIGIFITLIVILTIPLLFLLSHEARTLSSEKQQPTPTPARLTFSNGEGLIAGYVYHDNNKDGKREAEEKPFEDIKIQMKIVTEKNEEDGKTFDAVTDSYGYFSFRFPNTTATTYMLKVVVPQGYKTVDSNPLILSDLTPNMQKIVEFGLSPSGNVPLTPTRKPTATPKPTIEASPTP